MLKFAALLAAACLADPPAQVDQARLMASLRELPTDRAARGGPESIAGLERTKDLLVERLTALGYQPRLEEVRWSIPARRWNDAPASEGQPTDIHAHRTPPRLFHNVIVDLPGQDLAREVLLIGAHYDAVAGTPGADDNGTGVAALLELARVVKDAPMRRTVRMVFFTLEEVGLVGSRVHAQSYRGGEEPGERLVGMVSLEMLGYFTDEPGSQRSPVKAVAGVFEPPTVGNFISAVTIAAHADFCRRLAGAMEAAAPGVPVLRFDMLPVPVPDILRSDHAPFLALGVSAVMLTDTANFRNPNYHGATDTVDTIDARRFTLVVKGLAAAVGSIAEPADGTRPKQTTPGGEDPGR